MPIPDYQTLMLPQTKIVLIDGAYLAQLMIDYNLGCATDQMYEVKKVDGDYFGEE